MISVISCLKIEEYKVTDNFIQVKSMFLLAIKFDGLLFHSESRMYFFMRNLACALAHVRHGNTGFLSQVPKKNIKYSRNLTK